ALWGAFANLEYQSTDMTWVVHAPLLVNLLTHITVAWEIAYCALVWPRLTRPLVLFVALPLHLGIGACLGMMTFGTVMLIANLSFVEPALMRRLLAFGRSPAETEGRAERDYITPARRAVKAA